MYIYNYISIFKSGKGKTVACLLFLLLQGFSCTKVTATHDLYWIVAGTEENADKHWAEYLCNQLNHRAENEKVAVTTRPHNQSFLQVIVHVDGQHTHDYAVERTNHTLKLVARDESKLLWLIYQFISGTEDERLDVSDLPPAMIDLKGCEGNFTFEYRGLYTPSNTNEDLMPITASHNVDYDWGLWGHNLKRVFPNGVPEEAQAFTEGQRNPEQFCFSSEQLYQALEAYIIDNYGDEKGENEPVRFAVMPNDNEIICQCPQCTAKGNTPKSATPAVSQLLQRLAKRFPHHLFFTSAYLSTYTPPSGHMAPNIGVIISAMGLPMQSLSSMKSAKKKKFATLVNQWRHVTDRIYIWDYMRNFDDYLTPYPCLTLIGERLRYFHSLGVKGIFYNGSGYDYAALDDVQTATLAAMLINPHLSTNEYAVRCFHRYYPTSGDLLAQSYTRWEERTSQKQHVLPFYGGIEDAVKAWLIPDEFDVFCQNLDKKAKDIDNEERTRLNKLLTALQFTRLELLRMPHGHYDAHTAEICLESLKGHTAFKKEMLNYREASGKLGTYIKEWETLQKENAAAHNQLQGITLKPKYKLDAGYTDLSLLTDGKYALPSNYHTGWLIASSKKVCVEIPAGKAQNGQQISLSFLNAPRWRIRLPQAVEIWQDGKRLQEIRFNLEEKAPFTKYRLQAKLHKADPSLPLEIRITQGAGHRPTVACDEIELY